MFELLTPCYVIDANKFKENIIAFKTVFSNKWGGNIKLGYSIKTNHNKAFLNLAKEYGMYAEAVSDDEYLLAIHSGYNDRAMIFNGPQKSSNFFLDALKHGAIVNLDNQGELDVLKNSKLNFCDISGKIGLRVNFDLEKICPGETTAGSYPSRFGFCVENGEFASAIDQLHMLDIPISGLHLHYSSKTRSKNIFRALAAKAAELIEDYNLLNEIVYLDMGGGFFYGKNIFSKGKPDLETYATVISEQLKKVLHAKDIELILEPGAALISSAVEYYTTIINERVIRNIKMLTVDGSVLHVNPFMRDRNILYTIDRRACSKHKIINEQVICGSTCMENDRIALVDHQKELNKGDIIKCSLAGAYTMGFNNCFINLPPYIYLKKDDNCELIRKKDINLMKIL